MKLCYLLQYLSLLSLQLTLTLESSLKVLDCGVSPPPVGRKHSTPHLCALLGSQAQRAFWGRVGVVYEGHMHLAWLIKNHTLCAALAGSPILEKPVYFMVGDPWGLKPQRSTSKSIVSLPSHAASALPIKGSLPSVKRGQTHLLGHFPQPAWGARLPVFIPAVSLTLFSKMNLRQPCSFSTSLIRFLLWSCEKRGARN